VQARGASRAGPGGWIIGSTASAARALVWASCAAVLISSTASAAASEQVASFYGHKESGWFWYADPTPEPEEPQAEQEPTPVAVAAASGPAPMSVEWLRTNLPVLRDKAIDQPTTANVSAYYYAQRIMMDKAQVFSDKAREVTTSDPLLDENLRVPFASAAKAAQLRNANESKAAILAAVAAKAGLWFFHDDTCQYCESQVPIANTIARRYGIPVVYISRQGGAIRGLDPSIPVKAAQGRFEKLGVTHTPSVMMLVPPKDYYLIAQGFASLTSLEDRIVNAAHRYGLVEERLYQDAVPTSRGILSADTSTSGEVVDWNAPEQWVPHLKKMIADTYGIGEVK
jgi:conjugal transfer pilus assembly protein TraF